MDKTSIYERMTKAFNDYHNAHAALLDVWREWDTTGESFQTDYPFNDSFEIMLSQVDIWRNTSIAAINATEDEISKDEKEEKLQDEKDITRFPSFYQKAETQTNDEAVAFAENNNLKCFVDAQTGNVHLETKFLHGKFAWDDGQALEGYHLPNDFWNGYDLPYLTKDEADKLVEICKKDEVNLKWDGTVLKLYEHNSDELIDAVEPIICTTEHGDLILYPVGFNWTWQKEADTDNEIEQSSQQLIILDYTLGTVFVVDWDPVKFPELDDYVSHLHEKGIITSSPQNCNWMASKNMAIQKVDIADDESFSLREIEVN